MQIYLIKKKTCSRLEVKIIEVGCVEVKVEAKKNIEMLIIFFFYFFSNKNRNIKGEEV